MLHPLALLMDDGEAGRALTSRQLSWPGDQNSPENNAPPCLQGCKHSIWEMRLKTTPFRGGINFAFFQYG